MTQVAATTASPGFTTTHNSPDAPASARRVPLQDASLLAPLADLAARARTATAPSTGALTSEQGLPADMLDAETLRLLESFLPILTSGDPALLVAGLANELNTESRTAESTVVQSESAAEERAVASQAEANRRARSAARRARRMMGNAPKWLKKLVETIVVAAAATATAMSGGAAAGLAIAGAVLILGADGIAKAAEKLGMSPRNAGFLALACKIAGAALMAGAGGVGGGSSVAASSTETASSTAQTVRSVAESVSRTLGAANQINDGIRTAGAAVITHEVNEHQRDARSAEIDSEASRDALTSVLDEMRATAARYQRAMSTAHEMLEARARVQQSMIERMA